MSGEEELAFLKAHLDELSPAILRQLKRDILAETKRREAEDSAKTKGSGDRTTHRPVRWVPTRLCRKGGGTIAVSQKAHHATMGKRKAIDLDSSESSGSLELENRASGAESAPLPAQAKGTLSAQGPVVKSSTSTGGQAASSGRKLSFAGFGAAYVDRLKE
jgi:hypothetical protein